MDEKIQKKMAEYKKMAQSQAGSITPASSQTPRADSLSQIIRSKKDAEDFMFELENAIRRAK